MLTVWGRKNSSNVKKVLWCLEELNVAYHQKDVGGPFGGLIHLNIKNESKQHHSNFTG